MQASTPPEVHHHIPNTKLTQRDDTSESYLHARTHTQYRHASSQYIDACNGLIHPYVTMTIHTAHAQKHFSPETNTPFTLDHRRGSGAGSARVQFSVNSSAPCGTGPARYRENRGAGTVPA